MAKRIDAKTIDSPNDTLELDRAITDAFSKFPISSTAIPLIIFWAVTRPATQLGVGRAHRLTQHRLRGIKVRGNHEYK
jgi:hypothetical protein